MDPTLKLQIDVIADLFVKNKRAEADEAYGKVVDEFKLTRAECSMVKTEIFKRIDLLN